MATITAVSVLIRMSIIIKAVKKRQIRVMSARGLRSTD